MKAITELEKSTTQVFKKYYTAPLFEAEQSQVQISPHIFDHPRCKMIRKIGCFVLSSKGLNHILRKSYIKGKAPMCIKCRNNDDTCYNYQNGGVQTAVQHCHMDF